MTSSVSFQTCHYSRFDDEVGLAYKEKSPIDASSALQLSPIALSPSLAETIERLISAWCSLSLLFIF